MHEIAVEPLPGAHTSPQPVIQAFLPETSLSDAGIVIFPGGGYSHLAHHEGQGYAEFYTGHGMACFVVHYRLGSQGHRHPCMLEDALSAVYTVRKNAELFGLNPSRIGVMGSSAGGHLSAHCMNAWRNYPGGIHARPDFGILCYPVICSTGEFSHSGSMRMLCGDLPDEALLAELSCEKMVRADSPPCFIWHTAEDQAVPLENSIAYATSLRKRAIPFELHLFHEGRHGLGMNSPHGWQVLSLDWLRKLFALT